MCRSVLECYSMWWLHVLLDWSFEGLGGLLLQLFLVSSIMSTDLLNLGVWTRHPSVVITWTCISFSLFTFLSSLIFPHRSPFPAPLCSLFWLFPVPDSCAVPVAWRLRCSITHPRIPLLGMTHLLWFVVSLLCILYYKVPTLCSRSLQSCLRLFLVKSKCSLVPSSQSIANCLSPLQRPLNHRVALSPNACLT